MRKTELSSLKKRRMALVTGDFSSAPRPVTSAKERWRTSNRLYFRAGYLKSKLVRALVDHVGQEQGGSFPERRLLGASVAGHARRSHKVDQDFNQNVQVGLQIGVAVEKQGLEGQEEEGLFGVAVEDGLVLVSLHGGGRRRK